MISMLETEHVAASPECVWAFFTEMESHYLDWHREHLAWRDLKGKLTTPGGVSFGDEFLGWLRLSGLYITEEAEEPRFFSYRIGFPYSLVRSGGWFRIDPAPDGGCDVTAETHLGYRTPVVGNLVDRVLRAVVPIDDIRRHMREEGESLARLVVE
ncbi:MAG: SRPBCC family protein [Actinobacteria bacterium]|nr:SRPBCC family protein [Actinomycetota bacterium]